VLLDPRPVEGSVKKDDREIMEILEAFDPDRVCALGGAVGRV
jgi:hypothetical protein